MNTSSIDINSIHNGADGHKSPERLEQEVNQTRARIEDRLVSLTHRLSPGELLDQALGMAREHGSEFGHHLGTQVKQNPLPLLLTGIGLAWLMTGSRSSAGGSHEPRYARGSEYGDDSEYGRYAGNAEYAGEYPRGYQSPSRDSAPGVLDKAKGALGSIAEKAHDLSSKAHGAAERVSDGAHGAAEHARHLKSSVGERVSRTSDRVSRASDSMRERSVHVRERVQSTQQQLSDFFRDQPILAGSLGVALGAALGALLPPTETEDRLMGQTSADALERAKAAASQKLEGVREKARDTAQGAVQSVKDSMQGVKESVHEMSENVHAAASRQGSGGTGDSPYAAAPENAAQNNPSAF